MFQEAIAEQTAEHLRSHIGSYLGSMAAGFSGSNRLTLKVPAVNSATLVGGIMQVDVDEIPVIGVDCVEKQEIPSGESLWYYQYTGSIAGLASAASAKSADQLAKRYAATTERFIREHMYLPDVISDDFMLREFLYVNTVFSGAIEVDIEDEKVWMDGFTHNVIWVTSENQPGQHDA